MAPVYDTDLAQERWSREEWRDFELWEKIEIRLRRRKNLWIAATAILFLVLSAVPTVMLRWEKWMSLSAARQLATEIGRMKKDASLQHVAYRLSFRSTGALTYVIEKAASCSSPEAQPVREGVLLSPKFRDQYALLTPEQGAGHGLPGLVTSFCYDSLSGSSALLSGASLVGFGFISVKDLTENRMDRVSLLLLNGPSAEISFD